MESIPGSYPVWSTIPRVQEVHEQSGWDAGKHGEVRSVTGEGDGQICSEGYGGSWFAPTTNSQVSGSAEPIDGGFTTRLLFLSSLLGNLFFLPFDGRSRHRKESPSLRFRSCDASDSCLVFDRRPLVGPFDF